MRVHLWKLGIASLSLIFIGSALAQGTAQGGCGLECVEASKVGLDVQNALGQANLTGLSGLVLKKAVLTLETGSTVTGGVTINFIIFTIKHQTKKGSTITQEMTWGNLSQPQGPPATLESLKGVLASAIARSAALTESVTAMPLSEASITLKFVVDKDNGGSLSYKVAGINLGPSVDLDKVSTNTLTVTFAKP